MANQLQAKSPVLRARRPKLLSLRQRVLCLQLPSELSQRTGAQPSSHWQHVHKLQAAGCRRRTRPRREPRTCIPRRLVRMRRRNPCWSDQQWTGRLWRRVTCGREVELPLHFKQWHQYCGIRLDLPHGLRLQPVAGHNKRVEQMSRSAMEPPDPVNHIHRPVRYTYI